MKNILYIFAILLLLAACDKPKDKEEVSEKLDDTELLARVDGTRITEDDLYIIIKRTLGNRSVNNLTREQKEKFLESAIKSRGMALAAEKELSVARSEEIRLSVAAYREELLAKEYLRKHATPGALTSTRIEKFYKNNPELFGAKVTKSVQLINARPDKNNMAEISSLMNELRQQDKWTQSVQDNKSVAFKEFTYRKGLLSKQQEQIVQQLKSGETSTVHMINDEFYVYRVTSVDKSDAQPLSQVTGKIREYLLPQLIGEAVQQVSEELMKTTKVERIRNPG